MTFLGITVDTITLELDENWLFKLCNLLENGGQKQHASLKQIQSLDGILSFASSCIRQGRPFFLRVLNFLCKIPVKERTKNPNEVRKDIFWWKEIALLYNGVYCIPVDFWSKPDSWISTDDCLLAGECYFNGKYFHFDFSEMLIVKGKYINQYVLFVLWKAVELWGEKLRRRNILIYCDNKTIDCLRSGITL